MVVSDVIERCADLARVGVPLGVFVGEGVGAGSVAGVAC